MLELVHGLPVPLAPRERVEELADEDALPVPMAEPAVFCEDVEDAGAIGGTTWGS